MKYLQYILNKSPPVSLRVEKVMVIYGHLREIGRQKYHKPVNQIIPVSRKKKNVLQTISICHFLKLKTRNESRGHGCKKVYSHKGKKGIFLYGPITSWGKYIRPSVKYGDDLTGL